MKLIMARFEFKLQDFWIGVFWKTTLNWPLKEYLLIDIWICFIPCFPLYIYLRKKVKVSPATNPSDPSHQAQGTGTLPLS